jgi:hypothetical protein
MCPLLAPVFQGFFLWWPLTVLMKQTRQAVHAFKKSILLRCLWSLLLGWSLVTAFQGTELIGSAKIFIVLAREG